MVVRGGLKDIWVGRAPVAFVCANGRNGANDSLQRAAEVWGLLIQVLLPKEASVFGAQFQSLAPYQGTYIQSTVKVVRYLTS